MKADRDANKALSTCDVALAESRIAAKEANQLTREMRRMIREGDRAGAVAQYKRLDASTARLGSRRKKGGNMNSAAQHTPGLASRRDDLRAVRGLARPSCVKCSRADEAFQ
jgi:hypothetical protein